MSTIRLKRGTTSSWESQNYVLADGQPGVERTTGGVKLKIGDGSTSWNDLEYVGSGQFLPLSGGTMSGNINMDGYSISHVGRVTGVQVLSSETFSKLQMNGVKGITLQTNEAVVLNRGTGTIDANNKTINNIGDPVNPTDSANKQYVDTQVNSKLSLSGGTLTGTLKLQNAEASDVFDGLTIDGGNSLTLQSRNNTGLVVTNSGIDISSSSGYINITSDSNIKNTNYIRIGSADEKVYGMSLDAGTTAVSIGYASTNTIVRIGNSSALGNGGNVFLTGITEPSNDRDAVPYYYVRSKHWEFSFAPYGGGTLTASIRSFGKVVFFTIQGVLNIGSSAPSSGTFSEITIPAEYRPAYPVSIPVVEVSGGTVYGHTDRFTIGTDGSLSYVFANNGALERNCSACWVV